MVIDIDNEQFIVGIQIFDASKFLKIDKEHLRKIIKWQFKARLQGNEFRIDLYYQVIIVDQSEGTATKNIVESFNQANKTNSMRFIWHKQNEKGLTKARNVGVLLSNGNIVSFLDDDVVLFPDYFERIYSSFQDKR